MTPQKSKLYHLFLGLSVLNILIYYLLIGRSVLDIHNKDFFDDKIFNYYFSVSILVIAIWLTYFISRRKLTSKRLTWLHLFITFATVFILPSVLAKFLNPMPRRYYDYGAGLKLSGFFGNKTWTFISVGLILLTSELLLISNIRQQSKKLTLLDSEI